MKKECEDCGMCCFETEMIVSKEEIKVILSNSMLINQNLQDFIYKNKEGYFQLKNRDGHCYFFDKVSKTCKIYDIRPQGCRFYPLIYDQEKKNCILDQDCPHNHLFYQDPKDLKTICRELRNFLRMKLKIKV